MARAASEPTISKRSSAGFFSNPATFNLPIGGNFDAHTVRGYYIDMRVKAQTPTSRAGDDRLHIVAIQRALGCYERYLAGEGDAWLAAARGCADDLVSGQQPDGPQVGGFLHKQPFRHTFALRPPWISAIVQGEAASLLVRIFQETGDERYSDAARRALLPLSVDSAAGGVRAMLPGWSFPEEYPTQPPSFVLNGAIFTLWGLRDVGIALDDAPARTAFEEAVDGLAENLHRWDLGYWSRYDLFPHPHVNVASGFYHDLQVNQLRAMDSLAPRPELADMAERWAQYAASPLCRRRALAHKALFRLLVPRNNAIARRLPWSQVRAA